jgi:hypothetical protein
MARSKKSKRKPGPRANRNSTSINRSPPYEAPPSSPMPYIPPIATLHTDPDCDGASLNQQFPLSCARDEPGTKPLLELPSISSSPPKRGKKSRSRKARSAATSAATIQSAKLVQDQENTLNNSSSTYRVIDKAKSKRKKIQVQSSCRVLRPRRCKPTVNRELLVGGTSTSAMQLIQDKPNDDSFVGPK